MLKLSEAAARDIEILLERSISDFGIGQTEVYYSSLKNCFELLDNNPQMGIDAVDLNSVYRRFMHKSHVIFYQVQDDGIFIVRILHQRMDIIKHLDE